MAKNDLSPLLHLTYILQQSLDQELLKSTGVGLSQVRIMSVLSSVSAISQRAVALELRQTEANISRQLKGMQRGGLVGVTKNEKDGRQRDVSLTTKGEGLYQKTKSALNSYDRMVSSRVNKDQLEALNQAAERLLLAL